MAYTIMQQMYSPMAPCHIMHQNLVVFRTILFSQTICLTRPLQELLIHLPLRENNGPAQRLAHPNNNVGMKLMDRSMETCHHSLSRLIRLMCSRTPPMVLHKHRRTCHRMHLMESPILLMGLRTDTPENIWEFLKVKLHQSFASSGAHQRVRGEECTTKSHRPP